MTTMHKAARVALVGAATALAGCTVVGPEYREPPAVAAAAAGWIDPAAAGRAPTQQEWATWWQSLHDPVLDRLIASALRQSPDIRQSQSRLAEVRALRRAAVGRESPTLDTHGSVAPRRQSENGQLPIGKIPGLERDLTLYEAGFDASWEIDLFGRLRRGTESATAQVQASEDDLQGAQLSVAAEVARTYIALRGAQGELAARQQGVQVLERLLAATQRRVQVGDASDLDVDRARAQLDSMRAGSPGLQARVRASALALGLLLGQAPEAEAALADTAAADVVLARFPAGERADLLRRRPDVRGAERRLASATAEVGVAEAERFPRLVIGGNAGFQAQNVSDLFKSGSLFAGVVPTISWRIFDGGRVQAQIDASDARREGAAIAYEKAVLGALSDAERALSNYRLSLDGVQLQQAFLASAQRSALHAQRRFDLGDIGLPERLDAERTLYEAQEQVARTRSAALADMVALVKALGGGWGGTGTATASLR